MTHIDTLDHACRPQIRLLVGAHIWCRAASTIAIVLVTAICVAGCAQGATAARHASPTRPAPTATAVAGPLPRFSDWRAAYLGTDGRVHAVTLDGKTGVAGPVLPNLSMYSLVVSSEGVSPNGHLLAYQTAVLTIANLAAATSSDFEKASAAELAWSPDGSELALGDAEGSLWIVRASGASPVGVPGTPGPNRSVGVSELVGWIDSTHLAVTVLPANGPKYTDPEGNTWGTSIELGSIDIATGRVRIITAVSSPGLGNYSFSLSPDGSTALFDNAPIRTNPFTPIVEEISTSNGKVTPLSAIASATGANFTSLAWQPGTGMLAVTTGFIVNNNAEVWTLDPTRDTATQLQGIQGQYVAGWAPDSGPIITCNAPHPYAQVGDGPHDISAVTIEPDGHVSIIVLTHNAMTFPFLGFVRTG